MQRTVQNMRTSSSSSGATTSRRGAKQQRSSSSSLAAAARSQRQGATVPRGTRSSRPSRRTSTVRNFTSGPNTATTTTTKTRADSLSAQQRTDFCVSWAGAGVFFFWQLGAMKYLAERYDLTKVTMVGASGGSLAAVLAACGVPADRVIEHAYDLSVQHNIWEKPMNFLGAWGKYIEQWLDDLLPDNAHELCRGRITVVVTTLPNWGQIGISDFTSKQDLINACMASSHIPFALDGRLTRTCRGKQCVDGSFPDFFTGVNCEMLRYGPEADPRSNPAVVFDYSHDQRLIRKGRMDMLEIKSYEEIRSMYALGYEYAARLHADGRFSTYELSELLLQGEGGHMSEVLVPEHSGKSVPASSPSQQPQQQQQPMPVPVPAFAMAGPATQRSPLGLVLELQQDEQELVAGLQQQRDRHQQHQHRQLSPA